MFEYLQRVLSSDAILSKFYEALAYGRVIILGQDFVSFYKASS